MERIDPASLKRRVIFQSQAAGPDSSGDAEAGVWSDVVTVWGSMTPVSAAEVREGMASQHEISHRFVVRYRTGITSAMRIKFGTRLFAITGIRDVEDRQEFLEITALEGFAHV